MNTADMPSPAHMNYLLEVQVAGEVKSLLPEVAYNEAAQALTHPPAGTRKPQRLPGKQSPPPSSLANLRNLWTRTANDHNVICENSQVGGCCEY